MHFWRLVSLEKSIWEGLSLFLKFPCSTEAVIPRRTNICILQDERVTNCRKWASLCPDKNGGSLAACSWPEVLVPACTIKSLAFFLKSPIWVPISSSSTLRTAARGMQSCSPESPKGPASNPACSSWDLTQGPSSSTCDVRESGDSGDRGTN